MSLKSERISSLQYQFLIMSLVFGVSVLFIPANSAKHLGWLAVLAGMLEGFFFMYICTLLALKFPEKTIIEIPQVLLGSFCGKVISFLYIFYFIHLASLNLGVFGDFFKIIFPETPVLVFLIVYILICSSAVRNGIEVIARTSMILIPLIIFFYFFDTLALLKDLKFEFLLPISDIPLKNILKASHAISTIQFGEGVVFLMIIPLLNNVKEAKKSLFAYIFAGTIVAISAARNTAILGITSSITTYSTFQAMRLINIGEILNRLEIIVVVTFIAMSFLKISLLFYGGALGSAQLFRLHSYLPLVFPLGFIIIILTKLNFKTSLEVFPFAEKAYPYYALFFQVIFPSILLLLSIFKPKIPWRKAK